MSRYSDKRATPGCRIPDCTKPGTTLTIRHGELGWYCEAHKNK